MAKMKIYDIARSLQEKFPDLKSKDLIELLNKNGFEAKSAQSSIEDAAIGFLLKYYSKNPVKSTSKAEKEEKKTATMKQTKEVTQKKEPVEKKEVIQKKETEDKTTVVEEAPKQENSKKTVKNEEVKKDATTVEDTKKTEENMLKKERATQNKEDKGRQEVTLERQNTNTKNGKREGNRRDNNRENNQGDGRNRNNNSNGYNRGGNRNNNRNNNRDREGYRDNNRHDGANRNSNGGNRQAGYSNNRNGKTQGFDARRSAAAPMDSMKSEVKQSRQQRANKDSRSAKQRHGKDRNRDDYEDELFNQSKSRKKKDPNRKGAFIKPEPVAKPAEPEDGIRNIVLPEKMTIKELADIMKVPPATVIKKLFLQGNVVSMNHEITYEEAEEIALEYN